MILNITGNHITFSDIRDQLHDFLMKNGVRPTAIVVSQNVRESLEGSKKLRDKFMDICGEILPQ